MNAQMDQPDLEYTTTAYEMLPFAESYISLLASGLAIFYLFRNRSIAGWLLAAGVICCSTRSQNPLVMEIIGIPADGIPSPTFVAISWIPSIGYICFVTLFLLPRRFFEQKP